jgi:hypothetical protein
MNDWAEDAALKSAEQDKIRAGNIAKQNRESAVRAEIGPKLFKELSIWIVTKWPNLTNFAENRN